MTDQTSSKFINSNIARMIALLVALVLILIWLTCYKKDIMAHFDFSSKSGVPSDSKQTSPEVAIPEELAKCLEKRVGDVEQMKADGLLADDKYASFKSRAEQLCRQQNPG